MIAEDSSNSSAISSEMSVTVLSVGEADRLRRLRALLAPYHALEA